MLINICGYQYIPEVSEVLLRTDTDTPRNNDIVVNIRVLSSYLPMLFIKEARIILQIYAAIKRTEMQSDK